MINAVIFDLDGVITKTEKLHARAWKRLFDDFIAIREIKYVFTLEDYKTYIDGQAREAGIENFLVHGLRLRKNEVLNEVERLASLKNSYFLDEIDKFGVEVYEDAIETLNFLRTRGVKIGLATSSKNSKLILEKIMLSNFFDAIADGNLCVSENLNSKPEPDIFLWAIKALNSKSEEVIIVEDSLSGVKAGIRSNPQAIIHIVREGSTGEAVRSLNSDCVIQADNLDLFFKGYLQ